MGTMRFWSEMRYLSVLAGLLVVTGCENRVRNFNVKLDGHEEFEFNFTKGNRVEIWFACEGKDGVGLTVHGGEKGKEHGTWRSAGGREGYLRFIAPVSGLYRAEVGRGNEPGPDNVSGVITASESTPDKPWAKPGGLRPGTGNSRTFDLKTNEKATYYIPFTAGKKVEITVKSKGESDVDLFVYDERKECVKADTSSDKDCHVEFIAPVTQEYEVVVWNRLTQTAQFLGDPSPRTDARNGPNSGVLTFKDSAPTGGGSGDEH